MRSLAELEFEKSRLECELFNINNEISNHPQTLRDLWTGNTGLAPEEVDPVGLGVTKIVEPTQFVDMNDAYEWCGVDFHLRDGPALRVRLSDCGSCYVGFRELEEIGDDAVDTEGMGALEAWEFLSSKIPDPYQRVAAMVYRVYNGLGGA